MTKNILHIINGWPSGGIAEQTYLLCKYLDKKEFQQFSIGYCHFDGNFVEKFSNVGTPCLRSDESYSNIREIIETYNIDIVHKQTGGGDYPAYVDILHDMGIPLIETLHCPRKSGIPAEKLCSIVYTTPYTYYKNELEHMKKMVSIQYALDLPNSLMEESQVRESEFLTVGRLGRIVQDKRTDVILNVAILAEKDFGNKMQFNIAGYMPQDYPGHIVYGRQILEVIEQLPNVSYMGFVPDKYDFWKSLDICINPTYETSFDIVFLEAMACGIPILAWDESATKYVVGNAGLVTEQNPYKMYEGLKKLYYEPKLRYLLGQIGLEYIKTKYSLPKFIEEYTKLYRGVA